MKQFLVLFLAASLFISCKDNNKSNRERENERREKDDYRDKTNVSEEESSDKKESFNGDGWSQKDINAFNQQCDQTMAEHNADGSKICPCLLEKMQKRYSSMAEMDQKSTEAEGKKAAEDCMGGAKGNTEETVNTNSGGGSWTSAESSQFVNSCVSEAVKGGMQRSKAQSYCSCMQEKFETMYPNSADAANVTEEDMASPAMKRLIQNCLTGN